ncbi:hypothetical protein PSm6_34250 [Pseudomonas solani]|uniref:Uncharacterized protein n=1 Tax=Pseudomonas solani TaxID=2731552 RepID=A0ABM7LBT0_9PSED|nr:hypothetical protein PSm6_34250 [Pseudomonas solani]
MGFAALYAILRFVCGACWGECMRPLFHPVRVTPAPFVYVRKVDTWTCKQTRHSVTPQMLNQLLGSPDMLSIELIVENLASSALVLGCMLGLAWLAYGPAERGLRG